MRDHTVSFIEGEGIRYPGVGRCIYCGDTEAPRAEEHIIPFALVAHASVMEDACCKKCEREITRFEQPCLRQVYLFPRLRFDAPTRNPKSRPKEVEVVVQPLDDTGTPIGPQRKVAIPAADVPALVVSWGMPDPGIMMGRPANGPLFGRRIADFSGEEVERCLDVVRRLTGLTHLMLVMPEPQPKHLIRFIAKIAHAASVAIHGYDESRLLLTDLILGKSGRTQPVVATLR